jgi:glycosyltransferase involved in cell wall biosynthesis
MTAAMGPNPNDPIDVLIPTYNSALFLDSALNSVKRCVPVNRIIAVDRYSTDGTVEILLKHHAEIHRENKSLGKARQLLLANAKTNVVMMLDSDVVLEGERWYPLALKSLGSIVGERRRVGAVVLLPSTIPPLQLRKYTEFWWRLLPSLERDFFVTHSTLFLKEAVQGISVPEALGAAEDVYIWLQLRRRDFVTRTMRVKGVHYFSYSDRKGYWMGANLRILQGILGIDVLPFVLRNVWAYPILSAIAAAFTGDAGVLRYNLRRWRGYLQGYLQPTRYWQITRSKGAEGQAG